MEKKQRKQRKKKRVVDSATPPLVSFTLRLEQALFKDLEKLLEHYDGSRNKYIASLIQLDVSHHAKFQFLNTPVTTQPSDFPDSQN